jgi:hypothetical protein
MMASFTKDGRRYFHAEAFEHSVKRLRQFEKVYLNKIIRLTGKREYVVVGIVASGPGLIEFLVIEDNSGVQRLERISRHITIIE